MSKKLVRQITVTPQVEAIAMIITLINNIGEYKPILRAVCAYFQFKGNE
jgi:hypothetical protein